MQENNKQETSNKPQKKRRTNKVVLLIYFIMGALIAFSVINFPFAAAVFDGPIINIVIMTAFVILLFYLQIAVHEAGHMVCGLISGYKFSSYRFLSFMIYKKNGKLCFGRISMPGTGGQCLMIPPEMKDGKIPVFLYNIGGVVFNLLFSALLFILSLTFAELSLLASILLFGALSGIYMALTNGIPIKTELLANDGYNALSLNKDPAAVKSLYIQMNMSAASVNGLRLRDMPDEWFEMPSEDDLKNSMTASMAVILHSRYVDQHRFYEARELSRYLLESEANLVGIHRIMLMQEKIFLDLILDKTVETIPPIVFKFMKLMKTSPSTKRMEYTLALLKNGDPRVAKKALRSFEKIAKRYPYAQDIEAERELIDIVKEKYEKRTLR